MSAHIKIKYPGVKIVVNEIQPIWEKFMLKFYPSHLTPLENLQSRKLVDMEIFKSQKFLLADECLAVYTHPMTGHLLQVYRASPQEISEYFEQFPFGYSGADLSIFPQDLEWAIIINHDGDVFVTKYL
jgi:hypothetical protein